jgi:hypothetical protein
LRSVRPGAGCYLPASLSFNQLQINGSPHTVEVRSSNLQARSFRKRKEAFVSPLPLTLFYIESRVLRAILIRNCRLAGSESFYHHLFSSLQIHKKNTKSSGMRHRQSRWIPAICRSNGTTDAGKINLRRGKKHEALFTKQMMAACLTLAGEPRRTQRRDRSNASLKGNYGQSVSGNLIRALSGCLFNAVRMAAPAHLEDEKSYASRGNGIGVLVLKESDPCVIVLHRRLRLLD